MRVEKRRETEHQRRTGALYLYLYSLDYDVHMHMGFPSPDTRWAPKSCTLRLVLHWLHTPTPASLQSLSLSIYDRREPWNVERSSMAVNFDSRCFAFVAWSQQALDSSAAHKGLGRAFLPLAWNGKAHG